MSLLSTDFDSSVMLINCLLGFQIMNYVKLHRLVHVLILKFRDWKLADFDVLFFFFVIIQLWYLPQCFDFFLTLFILKRQNLIFTLLFQILLLIVKSIRQRSIRYQFFELSLWSTNFTNSTTCQVLRSLWYFRSKGTIFLYILTLPLVQLIWDQFIPLT